MNSSKNSPSGVPSERLIPVRKISKNNQVSHSKNLKKKKKPNPQTPDSVRSTAVELLSSVETSGVHLQACLEEMLANRHFFPQEQRLLTALVYGVTERRRTLDDQYQSLIRTPKKTLRPEVRSALQLGVYQLFYLDGIPAHAAIYETVSLIKHHPNPQVRDARNFVNAILRTVQRNGLRLPAASETDDQALSIRYALPKWLVSLWRESYPDDYLALCEHTFFTGTSTLRVNPLRTSPDCVAEQMDVTPVPGLPFALQVHTAPPISLPGYQDGAFHVQDPASQLCCLALDPNPGDVVYDLCAAPGGKSFTLAELMNDTGQIFAFDVSEPRLEKLRKQQQRLGLTCISALCQDVTAPDFPASAFQKPGHILCDVPCSCLGTIAKKPDLREKEQAALDKLPEIQYDILCNAALGLRPGYRLVYATCTLNPAENEAVCRRFLREHPQFQAVPVLPDLPGLRAPEGFLTLMSHKMPVPCDSFFLAIFIK